MFRLVTVLAVSSLFGLLCGFLSRSQNKERTVLWVALAGLVGTIGATTLQIFNPVLFDHFFSLNSWFEWFPHLGSGYSLSLLPRSLILLPIGFAGGFALSKVCSKGKPFSSYLPLLGFAACFLLTWGTQAEHLSGGVETRTYVYRFMPTKQSQEQSQEWNTFLEWNGSPYLGYAVYSRDDMPRVMQLVLGIRDVVVDSDPSNLDDSVFVFVKEYWVNGKKTSVIRTSKTGFKNAQELGSFFRNFARSRCSP